MVCEEKLRLTHEYQSASLASGYAVREVVTAMTKPKDEYERLLEKSDELRLASKTAGLRLEHHVGQHGC